MASTNQFSHPVGQLALHEALRMPTSLPATRSFVSSGARRTLVADDYTEEYYRPLSNTDGTLIDDLRFAFKHEPLDMSIVHAALLAIGEQALEEWVRSTPAGAPQRRA